MPPRRARAQCARAALGAPLVVALALVVPSVSATAGGASSPAVVSLGSVTSVLETTTTSFARDDGYSVPFPHGRDMWFFGDSFTSTLVPATKHHAAEWVRTQVVQGSTAAISEVVVGQVPTQMTEVQPNVSVAAPDDEMFLSPPHDAYMANGSGDPCTPAHGAAWQARWPSGAAIMPDNHLEILVTYNIACVLNGGGFTVEGWGFAIYNWHSNTFDVPPTDVFKPQRDGAALPSEDLFSSPVAQGDDIDLFSTTGCPSGGGTCTSLDLTSVLGTEAALSNPASYQPAPSTTNYGLRWDPSVNVTADPWGGFFATDQQPASGKFFIAHAPTALGPWSAIVRSEVPCTNYTFNDCRTLVLHPELSTHSSWILTYFDPVVPDPQALGHLVGVAITAP